MAQIRKDPLKFPQKIRPNQFFDQTKTTEKGQLLINDICEYLNKSIQTQTQSLHPSYLYTLSCYYLIFFVFLFTQNRNSQKKKWKTRKTKNHTHTKKKQKHMVVCLCMYIHLRVRIVKLGKSDKTKYKELAESIEKALQPYILAEPLGNFGGKKDFVKALLAFSFHWAQPIYQNFQNSSHEVFTQ